MSQRPALPSLKGLESSRLLDGSLGIEGAAAQAHWVRRRNTAASRTTFREAPSNGGWQRTPSLNYREKPSPDPYQATGWILPAPPLAPVFPDGAPRYRRIRRVMLGSWWFGPDTWPPAATPETFPLNSGFSLVPEYFLSGPSLLAECLEVSRLLIFFAMRTDSLGTIRSCQLVCFFGLPPPISLEL